MSLTGRREKMITVDGHDAKPGHNSGPFSFTNEIDTSIRAAFQLPRPMRQRASTEASRNGIRVEPVKADLESSSGIASVPTQVSAHPALSVDVDSLRRQIAAEERQSIFDKHSAEVESLLVQLRCKEEQLSKVMTDAEVAAQRADALDAHLGKVEEDFAAERVSFRTENDSLRQRLAGVSNVTVEQLQKCERALLEKSRELVEARAQLAAALEQNIRNGAAIESLIRMFTSSIKSDPRSVDCEIQTDLRGVDLEAWRRRMLEKRMKRKQHVEEKATAALAKAAAVCAAENEPEVSTRDSPLESETEEEEVSGVAYIVVNGPERLEKDESLQQMTRERWVDDKQVLFCHGCQAKFSVVRRKHHCRRCGNVYCNKCSPKSPMHSGARICVRCLSMPSPAEQRIARKQAAKERASLQNGA
jgi:hypothetical protein